MMIKANGEYLDFNGDIEIESQIKLFEDIESVNGDFSYEIEIQDNGQNRKALGIPRADTVKSIYQSVPSEVIDDTGQTIYRGHLQVNRISGGFISSTFYSGNTEWFAALSAPMSSLPLYRYDVDLSATPVYESMFVDEGIVFPVIDAGALVTRSFTSMKIEDFVPCFYVKTLFNEIFNPLGIKLQGDFIEDATFKKLVVAANGRSQEDIELRSSYANKISTQSAIALGSFIIVFSDDSTFPFFDGSSNNWNGSRYTADVKMRLDFSVNLSMDIFLDGIYLRLLKNGVAIKTYQTGDVTTYSKTVSVDLNAGDYLEWFAESFSSAFSIFAGSTVRARPTFIYKAYGNSSVPNWTQVQFVSNILRLFNVLPSYNPTSKTLTLDLFNNIKAKEYVDISNEIVIDEIDFSTLVSDYAKNNIFTYQESDDEDLRQYNISSFISYGSGNLTIDNDYIENDSTIVESDFTSPITYLNGVFDMSMERINFVELAEGVERDITSVSDASGVARFNISNASTYFAEDDLVRIDTEVDTYNGDWVVDTVTGTYITVKGGSYDASTTGSVTLLTHQFTTDDNVYLFINVPNVELPQITSIPEITIDDSSGLTGIGIAYFNMLSNGRPINRIYKQSLSFGSVNNPLSYQLTLLDTYWPLFSRILNSPVSLQATGYLKRSTFDQIKTFLRPVRVVTEETSNLYYVNRNRGYKGSERPCELELIKLN